MTISKKITARRAEVLALVLAQPGGMSASSLGRALGITRESAAEHLRKLRRLGLLMPAAEGGPGVMWCAVITAEQLRIERADQVRADIVRKRRAMVEEAKFDRFLAGHRVTVPAETCRAPVMRAPVSVFNQAGCMHRIAQEVA